MRLSAGSRLTDRQPAAFKITDGRGLDLIRLAPVDAPHYVWPVVETALRRVKEKTGDKWTPAFVFDRILGGHAGLFRFTDDGEHVAWMVVERYDQGETWMNVWIVEGAGLDRGVECMALVDTLARQIGASSWRCTGRKGWGRALGIKPIATVYERNLI